MVASHRSYQAAPTDASQGSGSAGPGERGHRWFESTLPWTGRALAANRGVSDKRKWCGPARWWRVEGPCGL